jgi:hypothetical protein
MEDVMLLSDATSREQVEAALAAGDESYARTSRL